MLGLSGSLNFSILNFGLSHNVIGTHGRIKGSQILKMSSLIGRISELIVNIHLNKSVAIVVPNATITKVGAMCLNFVE